MFEDEEVPEPQKPEDVAVLDHLEDLINQYKNREYKQTLILDQLPKLAKKLAKISPECSGCEIKATLLIVYDALMTKEHQRKPY